MYVAELLRPRMQCITGSGRLCKMPTLAILSDGMSRAALSVVLPHSTLPRTGFDTL